MTNLHHLFEEATVAAPPSRLSVEDVLTATRTQRRRRHANAALALIAALATAAAGGIAFTAKFAAHPPAGAAPPHYIVWAQRGDATNLYLVRDTCGRDPRATATPDATPAQQECHELLWSGDSGATWVARGTVEGLPRVLGPRTLWRYVDLSNTPLPHDWTMSFELSNDAGATWDRSPGQGPPIDAVPPGETLAAGFGDLLAYDPAQGRLRKLAHPPALISMLGEVAVVGTTHILISGINPITMSPAVAASHDGGATWTERDLPGSTVQPQRTLSDGSIDPTTASGQPMQLITGDGVTAYATMWDGESRPEPMPPIPGVEGWGWYKTYRTTDGGQSWQRVATVSTTPSYSSAWVAGDGRIVVTLLDREVGGGRQNVFAVTTDGVTYAQAEMTGLPTRLQYIDGKVAYSDSALYLSDDGWTWREVWRVPR